MSSPARTRTSLYSRLQPARFSHPDRPLPKKENSAAPAAGSFAHGGKGTKTPFFRPLRLELPSGGQTLSGCPLSFRATGPWREKGRKHAPLLGSAWPVPCCSAGGNRRAFLVQPDRFPKTVRPAAAARNERQSYHCPRRRCGTVSREASPVMGSGVGDWSAGAPRSRTPAIFVSFHRWKEQQAISPPFKKQDFLQNRNLQALNHLLIIQNV